MYCMEMCKVKLRIKPSHQQQKHSYKSWRYKNDEMKCLNVLVFGVVVFLLN
jgi:hypothetical protein